MSFLYKIISNNIESDIWGLNHRKKRTSYFLIYSYLYSKLIPLYIIAIKSDNPINQSNQYKSKIIKDARRTHIKILKRLKSTTLIHIFRMIPKIHFPTPILCIIFYFNLKIFTIKTSPLTKRSTHRGACVIFKSFSIFICIITISWVFKRESFWRTNYRHLIVTLFHPDN